MKTTTSARADDTTAIMPARIESCAEARADRALLDDGQRRRQRAGAQQDGEIVGALHGEVAAESGRSRRGSARGSPAPRSPRCRARWRTAGRHSPASPRRTCARRAVLKRKLTTGSPVRWSKPGWASVRSSPVTRTRFSTMIGRRRLVLSTAGSSIRRARRLARLLGVSLSTRRKVELGGLAEQLLQPRRVPQARHLHQDAVGALALDRRLDRCRAR